MNMDINGVILTNESIDTIRGLQADDGIVGHIEALENMIDILLCDDIPSSLEEPKTRLSHIQDLRYLEKLILTFKKTKNDGKR